MTTLLCDVGGVLIENPWVGTSRVVGGTYGLDEKRVFDLLTREALDLDSDRVTLGEFHLRVCRSLAIDMTSDRFRETVDGSLVKITPVWDAVRSLRESGRVKVVALSNMAREVWASLQSRFAIDSLFDSEVLSYELGVQKPDPEIYRTALEKAGEPAGRCFFVDDVIRNIDAAKSLGIGTFRALRPEETAEFVASLAKV